jgi:hypothetical protein
VFGLSLGHRSRTLTVCPQLKCQRCRGYNKETAKERGRCFPPAVKSPTALAKCGVCRTRGVTCSWSTKIPLQLTAMKIAIHTDMAGPAAEASGSNPSADRSSPQRSLEVIQVSSEDDRAQIPPHSPSRSPTPDMVEITKRALEAAALESEVCYQELLEGVVKAYAGELPPLLED